jgi:membrane fusion protein (multidrug efflux system)
MEVRTAEVPLTFTYTGRVSGFREVEVRPQVGGIMLKREFEEGSRVKEGQVLFRIDPSTYQAALDRARAQLAQAQATQRQAEENFQRTEELVRRQVATQRQLDDARAARDQAVAGVQLAEAEVRTAQLNLDHTIITAPVSGVTSLQSPPEGTLIQAPQTLLTQINQLDPAYVIFSITDAEYLAFRNLNQRRARPVTERDITVELQYGNGSIYPQKGRIDVSASSVDPLTGTLQVRAIFPNADGAILPGEFVRVIVTGITLPDAIVIPKQAVNQGPQGPFVYAVGENNTAQVLPIRLGRELQSGWVVQSGLSPGQRIVVDGVIRVRPGAPVQPVPVTVDPATLAGTPSDAGGEATGSLGVPR